MAIGPNRKLVKKLEWIYQSPSILHMAQMSKDNIVTECHITTCINIQQWCISASHTHKASQYCNLTINNSMYFYGHKVHSKSNQVLHNCNDTFLVHDVCLMIETSFSELWKNVRANVSKSGQNFWGAPLPKIIGFPLLLTIPYPLGCVIFRKIQNFGKSWIFTFREL